ncbi:hypothetical protein F0U61_45270 [Archangium violaceum]|uniref:hypothetical protein n=1 Tax=Archangium violaceum TaxID=83451 RepID=UPI002B29D928|nr:hypothetical protein F0U61_45270 [Archangium violaceum]
MYFKAIKNILDDAINSYSQDMGEPVDSLCAKMGAHLQEMAKQHREDDPVIAYNEPLCRLAYLYKHVAANATLCERALSRIDAAKKALKARAGKKLRVCSVGGGPGSELLGLVKFLVRNDKPEKFMPERIDFTIFDLVPQWGESWGQLANQAESILKAEGKSDGFDAPAIAHNFYPLDITKKSSYKDFAWLLKNVDLVIFNYVISENIEHLDDIADALKIISTKSNDDAALVFIDRKEHSNRINDWLIDALPDAGFMLTAPPLFESGILDGDDQVSPHLGQYPKKIGQNPRTKFWIQTSQGRIPTAFFLAAQKTG